MTFVELPGYSLKYDKNRALTILRIIGAIPKILIRVKQEKVWLKRFAGLEQPDLIISDNRYGLVIPGVFCVFMTHQLLIRTPFGAVTDRLLQQLNYRFIRRFSRCWVPDIAGEEALAGQLSNPARMPAISVRYIGWLSRMSGQAGAQESTDLLVLLSGPEPQRTILERRILRQAAGYSGRIVLVRGLPGGAPALRDVPAGVVVHDHLAAAELEKEMAQTRLVIARSGYSTIMDLVRMGKRALLIPTPGQTEQEYLGLYLASKGWAACVEQDEFSLAKALMMADSVSGWPVEEAAGEALRREVVSVLTQARAARSGPMA
ncbi:glycosyltransferase [Puia dinghuensis]|uniref:Glycosyl transferase n=1 Tax=Puia dinghuensis TaxID=1792502 RepID=A0A8J2XVE7_9BACT|nr:glycosyltransferase [Puia dinghuensis]GGB11918.1 glycosyl transferase [Puia dinghuensis]